MHMHMLKKLVSVSQSRRASLYILSRRLPVRRCLLEPRILIQVTLGTVSILRLTWLGASCLVRPPSDAPFLFA